MRFKRSVKTRSLSTLWMTTCWIVHLPTFQSGSGGQSKSSRVSPRIASESLSPPLAYWSISSRSMAEPLLSLQQVVVVQRRAGEERHEAGDRQQDEQPGTDPPPALLRRLADRQPPGDRGRPEPVGEVVARRDDADDVDRPDPPVVQVPPDGAERAVRFEAVVDPEPPVLQREHVEQHEEDDHDRADP